MAPSIIPDTATITFNRPALNQTASLTINAEMLQVLDWLVANGKNSTGGNYTSPQNVIFQDCLDILRPKWVTAYKAGLQNAVTAAADQLEAAATAGIVVSGQF